MLGQSGEMAGQRGRIEATKYSGNHSRGPEVFGPANHRIR
jgi:hypothetical protein